MRTRSSKLALPTFFIGIFSLVLAFEGAHADVPVQLERFETSLSALENVLAGDSEPNSLVSRLLSSDSRAAAFNLQALGKIYENLDDDFEKVRNSFKELEDKIGNYDRWNLAITRARKEGLSRERIRHMERERTRALSHLNTLLLEERWLDANPARRRISRVRHFLSRYSWPAYSEDRKLVLDDLLSDLEALEKRNYDMSSLDSSRGMHQLRRDLRWFLIKARALNGFLTFRDDNNRCPLDFYRAAGLREDLGHYGGLPSPSNLERNACAISACLFRGLVITVNSIGEIKDEAEYREALGNTEDTLDTDLQERAEQLYAELRSQRLLSMLTSELHACR